MQTKINIDSAYNAAEEINCLTKDNYYPLYKALNELLEPQSVADLGCRVGHLITLFKENNGIDVLGIDYFSWNKEAANDIIKDDFIVADLRDSLTINNTYDLVVSTEVGEHIDPNFSIVYLENIKAVMNDSSKLVMTWAPNPCEQHLNPLNKDAFFSLMRQSGFVLQETDTENLISLCVKYGLFRIFHWYFTGNLSVWKK